MRKSIWQRVTNDVSVVPYGRKTRPDMGAIVGIDAVARTPKD